MLGKNKFLLPALTAVGVVSSIATISLTVSCKKEFYVHGDIGGLNTWIKENNLTGKVAEKAKEIKNDPNNKKGQELLNQKIIQISTGGKVNDKSFNQLVWETVSNFSEAIGNKNNRYYETAAINQNMQNDAYDYAISNGFKIWILTGFQQETLLKNWLKIGKNQERFNNAGTKIITVDWYSNDLTLPGRLMGLNFKTQESTFVVGYAASKLLSEIYPGDKNIDNRYLNSFGGGDFSGVTNFNYGFYDGLRVWNNEQTDNQTKIKTTTVNSSESIDLTTGFSITNDAKQKVYNAIDGYATGKHPKIVLPVAGPLTSIALDRVKEKKSDQWIIGVDTDMSLSFPSDKGNILTSSEKKIAIAIYKALISFAGMSNVLEFKDESQSPKKQESQAIKGITMGWDGNNYIINDEVTKKPTNFNVVGGYAEGFVGVSKSTLNSKWKFNDGPNKGKTYAQRFDEIVDETWIKFFGPDKISGLFEGVLKPTLEQIEAGPIAYTDVKYGSMTAGNLTSYFNPAVEQINNWSSRGGKK